MHFLSIVALGRILLLLWPLLLLALLLLLGLLLLLQLLLQLLLLLLLLQIAIAPNFTSPYFKEILKGGDEFMWISEKVSVTSEGSSKHGEGIMWNSTSKGVVWSPTSPGRLRRHTIFELCFKSEVWGGGGVITTSPAVKLYQVCM